jgi:hypothetical protein
LEIFDDSAWQMSRGERAALEGILTQTRPGLAIEVGSGEGGSLARIALHADEVHAFDFIRPQREDDRFEGVAFHTGDPLELLPAALAELAQAGRNVDFVLIDGDCAPDGARRALEVLLDSPALTRTTLLVHHANNERVRQGLDRVHFSAWPKVAYAEPDFVPGYMVAEERARHQLWGGLALVLVDAARLRYHTGSVVHDRHYPAGPLFAEVRDYVAAREHAAGGDRVAYPGTPIDPAQAREIEHLRRDLAEAEAEIQRLRSVARHHEELWRSLMDSWSWRMTEPIRMAKGRVRGGDG